MKFNLRNILSKKTENQFKNFIIIGIITGILYYLLLILFTEKFKIYYIFSAIIAGIIGTTIKFILNKEITFKEKLEKSFFKEYWKFGIISIALGILGIVFLFALTDLIGIHYLISSLLIISITSTTGFIANKFLNFKK